MLNQTFLVIYGNYHYLVDPNMLFNSSRKFAQLVQPFGEGAKKCQLVILNQSFSERCINNFLKLVQRLPTDVMDSEMKEICEIAKMFQANQIYETGINFIRQSIDPSFYVPDSKYENGTTYLKLEFQVNKYHRISNLEFDSDIESDNDDKTENDTNKKQKEPPVIYEIHSEKPMMKKERFYFLKNGQPLYSAKKKCNFIAIGKGDDIHLKSSTINRCGEITQEKMKNIIRVNGQTITLQYVHSGDSKVLSMNVSFLNNDKQMDWTAKEPKYNFKTGTYCLKLAGEYHHKPLNSSKNSALKDSTGKTVFITRMMAENFYEVECSQEIDQIIAFAIGLSSVIGPTVEPNADSNIY